MQVFMPFNNLRASVSSLDDKRLPKQLVECKQILLVIDRVKAADGCKDGIGYANHPIIDMWYNHVDALYLYLWHGVQEWKQRGIRNRGKAYSFNLDWVPDSIFDIVFEAREAQLPAFMGIEPFHASHRLNLIRKKYGYYMPQYAIFTDMGLINRCVDCVYLWYIPSQDTFRVGNTDTHISSKEVDFYDLFNDKDDR